MFVPIVLLMFAVPYVASFFRDPQEQSSTLSQVDGEELVNQPRLSIVAMNEPAAASAMVLYRSA